MSNAETCSCSLYNKLYTRAHLTSYLPTVYNPHKSSMAAYQVSSFLNLKMANEKCRKNVVVLYVINAIHISTII